MQVNNKFTMNIGIISFIVVFIILCLMTFSILSLVSAQSNLDMTNRILEHTSEYYQLSDVFVLPTRVDIQFTGGTIIKYTYGGDISESEVTDELVRKVFEKYLALQKYALPMLANVEEYSYFSFFRQILLYISKHDTYPDFPIDSSFKCPTIPEIYDFEIDMDY